MEMLTCWQGGYKASNRLCVVVLFDMDLNVFSVGVVGVEIVGTDSTDFSQGPEDSDGGDCAADTSDTEYYRK